MRWIERSVFFALVVLTACFCASNARAQPADSLILQARKAAFDKQDYQEAIRLANTALIADRRNTELLVFLGRLYTWNKQPDSARIFLAEARKTDPKYVDAFAAAADLEYWEKAYDAALQIVEEGLALDAASQELLERKALILYDRKEYSSALTVADTLLQINRGNARARALADRIRDNASRNRIGLKYDYIHFDRQFADPWQYLSLDYTYQSRAGAFTARMNYANRFRSNGVQYEAEAYPTISRRFYAYLNIGYSDDANVFPRWKAGASLLANLPAAFEAELGLRYLLFEHENFIYTAYVGKYLGSFLLGARIYLAPNDNNFARTYSLLARYYYGGVDDYAGLTAGTGISPDDRQTNVQLENPYKLKSYRIEFSARKAIRRLNVFVFNASYTNQEYLPQTAGNQLQVGAGLIRRF